MQTRQIGLIAVLLFLAGSAFSSDNPDSRMALDASQLAWQRIDFRARKFTIDASSIVEWSLVDASKANVDWIDAEGIEGAPDKPIEPGEQVLRLGYISDFIGQHFDTVYWMNPRDGAALQYETTRTSGRPKHRIYRFTNQGAYLRTWRPIEDEAQLPWENWTERSGDFRPFQPEAHNRVVIGPLGLIYITAASDLGRGRNRLEVLAFVRREVIRAILTEGEIVDIDADFIAQGPSGEKQCTAKMKALKISLAVEGVGDNAESDFDFFGLRSDIEIFLSPESRLPLRISGNAKIVGPLVINAKHVRMIDDRGCPKKIGVEPI
jgi:hypothetical protein